MVRRVGGVNKASRQKKPAQGFRCAGQSQGKSPVGRRAWRWCAGQVGVNKAGAAKQKAASGGNARIPALEHAELLTVGVLDSESIRQFDDPPRRRETGDHGLAFFPGRRG